MQVRNAPITVQNVVTYDTVISVSNDDLKLKPGMTANVSIIIAQRESVLTIKNAALRFRPPEAIGNRDVLAFAGSAARSKKGGSARSREMSGRFTCSAMPTPSRSRCKSKSASPTASPPKSRKD